MQPARSDPPRLLIVSTVAVTMHRFLRPYAEHFRSLGWHVEGAANGLAADGATRQVFDAVYEVPLSRSLRDPMALLRGWRTIRSAISRARPDLVHTHTPIASFLVRLAARMTPKSRRPIVVYTAHGFHFQEGGHRLTDALFIQSERLAGRWTDRLIVINEEDESAARRLRIVPDERLVRMPGIGLDTSVYAPDSVDPEMAAERLRQLGLGDGTPYFVLVGEFSRRKRQADAIEALARMRHDRVRLVLVGSGPTRADVEALVGQRGLASRVRFTGPIADVQNVLTGALALLSTSDREGLSRAVMEALALEVPVIVSTAGGNRELAEQSGGTFDIGDVDGLTTWMDWFVDHPDEAREMGRVGRRRMVDHYDLRWLVERHERLYAELLGSATRSAS